MKAGSTSLDLAAQAHASHTTPWSNTTSGRCNGEADEVAFTWASSRAANTCDGQLTGFNGTLLSDGYAVIAKWLDTTQ